MNLLLLFLSARADDPPPPAPAAAPTSEPAPPTEPAPAAGPAPVAGPTGERVRESGLTEELIVRQGQEVLRRRAELFEALDREGYVRRLHRSDRTIFLSEDPWKPRIIVHDDGWVYFRRQPPRVHAPGRSFADQGSPAAYLLCIIAPTSCVSVGGWLVSDRKMGAVESRVLDSTRDKVRALNDAVARRELGRRLNEDIPNDLAAVWARTELEPAERRILLFEYWDSRTDTPEGDSAKRAIEAYFRGEIQQSDAPFTPDELAALNAKRQSIEPLDLSSRAEP